jgi:hypothetical protein
MLETVSLSAFVSGCGRLGPQPGLPGRRNDVTAIKLIAEIALESGCSIELFEVSNLLKASTITERRIPGLATADRTHTCPMSACIEASRLWRSLT